MKVGIDSYCYHRFFGEVYPGQEKPAQPYTVDKFINRARDLGCGGVSLESCFLPSFDRGFLTALRAQLDAAALDRVYAWGHPHGLAAGTDPAALEEMIRHLDHAAAIGAPVMRIVASGPDHRSRPHAPQLDILAGWLRTAAAIAADKGVRLALENHIDFTAAEIRSLVERVGSPYFGVTLDTGNFVRIGEDVLAATRLLAPHVFATHIKDVRPVAGLAADAWCYFSTVLPGEGVVPVEAVVHELHRTGYRGLLAYETDMPHPDYAGREEEMVAAGVRHLQTLVASLRTPIPARSVP